MDQQDAQGRAIRNAKMKVEDLGGISTSCFNVPWSSWASFWLSLGFPVNSSNLLIFIV